MRADLEVNGVLSGWCCGEAIRAPPRHYDHLEIRNRRGLGLVLIFEELIKRVLITRESATMYAKDPAKFTFVFLTTQISLESVSFEFS